MMIVSIHGQRHGVGLHAAIAAEHVARFNGEQCVSASLRGAHHGNGGIFIRIELGEPVEVKRNFHNRGG